MNRLGWSLVCVLALGAGACDGDNGGADAGADAGTEAHDASSEQDAHVAQDAGVTTPAVLASVYDTRPVGDAGTETYLADQVPADFSCRGTLTAPTGSGDSTFTVTAKDFMNHDPIEGLMVQLFPDNAPTLDGSCTGTCQLVTTDAMGQASVMGTEGAWFAYRVLAGSGIDRGTPHDYIAVAQFNNTTPASGGDATLNVITGTLRNSIIALLGSTLEEGTGVITGAALDCMGREVANATVRVFDSDGEIDLDFLHTGPREFYFNGEQFPAGTERATNSDGLYGAANLPIPSDSQLRVELWGALTEGGEPEMLGCERVQVAADGITILNVGPTRSDGPTDCSGT